MRDLSDGDFTVITASRDTDEPLVRVRISVKKLEDEEKLRENLKTLSLLDCSVRVREEVRDRV